MSKKENRVIPTLDDVIKPGVLKDTPIGDLSQLSDELNKTKTRPSTPSSPNTDDNIFTEDFEKIFANADNNRHRLPDEIVNESARKKTADKDNSPHKLADAIVTERFKPDASTTLVTKKHETPKSAPAQKAAAAPAKTRPPARANTETVKATPVTPASAKIDISEIVDEITRKLMPEIEWKIRTRIREALELHLSVKDCN